MGCCSTSEYQKIFKKNVVNEYEVIGNDEKIEKFEFGKLYKVRRRNTDNGNIYALRRIQSFDIFKHHRKYGEKKIYIESKVREINVLMNTNHPYIEQYYDCFISDNDPFEDIFVVTKYYNNERLIDHAINANNKYPKITEKIAKKYTKQIIQVIRFCHENNIIHRNINMKSILMEKDETSLNGEESYNIKLCGFHNSVWFEQYDMYKDEKLSSFMSHDHLKAVATYFDATWPGIGRRFHSYFWHPALCEMALDTLYYKNREIDWIYYQKNWKIKRPYLSIWSLKKWDTFTVGVIAHILLCGEFPFMFDYEKEEEKGDDWDMNHLEYVRNIKNKYVFKDVYENGYVFGENAKKFIKKALSKSSGFNDWMRMLYHEWLWDEHMIHIMIKYEYELYTNMNINELPFKIEQIIIQYIKKEEKIDVTGPHLEIPYQIVINMTSTVNMC